MGARPLETCQHLVPLGNLLFDRPVHVGNRGLQATQHVLQPLKAWSLARKWSLLHHVLPEELPRSVDISLVQDFLYESTYNATVTVVALHVLCPQLDSSMLRFRPLMFEMAAKDGSLHTLELSLS